MGTRVRLSHETEKHVNEHIMLIPYQQLPPDTLENIIKDWLSRQSQESLDFELSEQAQIEQVVALLGKGELLVSWDDESQTINLMTAQYYAQSMS